MKKKLIIPKFKNENEERAFWSGIDLSEFFTPADFKLLNQARQATITREIAEISAGKAALE